MDIDLTVKYNPVGIDRERQQLFFNIVNRVAERGREQGGASAGAALSTLLGFRLLADEGEDPRVVVLNALKDLRAAMTEVRDEIDCLDSVGKYK